MNVSRVKIILLGLCLAPLAACAPIVKDGQPTGVEQSVILRAGESVGQTFTARDRGLNGIQIFLSPATAGTGTLQLHLRADSQSSQDLAASAIDARTVTGPGFYRFEFSPQPNSRGHDYYLLLETTGSGTFRVATAAGNAYLEGALYQNGNPIDAQLTFQLAYDPIDLLIGLGAQKVTWAQIISFAILLFVLPGWAVLAWLLPSWRELSWGERLGLASGTSLALYPVLLLWTNLINLRLGALYAWLPVIAAVAALGWRHRAWRPGKISEGWRVWRQSEFAWSDIAFAAVIGLILLTRFWVIRSLDVPMWGDSYQHTMIAQLIVDHGGLFDSWLPYVPYNSLTVQFGFPADVAVLTWLSGIQTVPAALWVGQILNVLAIITLYPLAVRLAEGNRWAGVGAVLVAGLLSPMPAMYVNWGRYAQLAGQAILPIALWLFWESLEREKFGLKTILLAGITLAGMMLTYYRMPFYYAAFVLAWLVGWGLVQWQLKVHAWLRGAIRAASIAGCALLLFLPWLLHVSKSNLANVVEGGAVMVGSLLDSVIADYRTWVEITTFVPFALIALGLIALGWSMFAKRWVVASIGLWVLILSGIVAGRLIRLPGANLMQSFAVMIALYIPVGLLIGWAFGEIASAAARRGQTLGLITIIVLVVGVGAGSAAALRLAVPLPQTYAIVTRADERAMGWIRSNVPAEARFLVEGFRIYDGISSVGADAGWWIPLLTGRANTMPPQYALINEVPLESDYSTRVTELVAGLEKSSPSSPDGLRLLCDWHITHVYIGQTQGQTGAGVRQLFSLGDFLNKNNFHLVYHQDRVYIFSVTSPCSPDA